MERSFGVSTVDQLATQTSMLLRTFLNDFSQESTVPVTNLRTWMSDLSKFEGTV